MKRFADFDNLIRKYILHKKEDSFSLFIEGKDLNIYNISDTDNVSWMLCIRTASNTVAGCKNSLILLSS